MKVVKGQDTMQTSASTSSAPRAPFSNTVVITTVRDDLFFLRRWVDYYGGLFGREALFIVNHGNGAAVREIAAGCNLIPIPDGDIKNFNFSRWRTQNALLTALRQWYAHVIVCDVDEFIVVDPDSGHDLASWLAQAPVGTVYSPLGFDILHLRDREPDPVSRSILGPRRHASYNPYYTKPCIVSCPATLSRGGHYSSFAKLDAPEFLYLFHMKYCDFDAYVDMLNRRHVMVSDAGISEMAEKRTKASWFDESRDDAAIFAPFMTREVAHSWDFRALREHLHKTFTRRNESFFHFKRHNEPKLFEIPERFSGLV